MLVAERKPIGQMAQLTSWNISHSRSVRRRYRSEGALSDNYQGTQQRTQHQLELEIENMGGHLNAYTSV